ncbi:Pleckstrin homology domain-containing protein [Aspergillus ambiguus]|uniref:uncharacterized protein n=1 Tax=Aspergillus ambiguus TaxID=176160 RepID=UPI003CCD509F
MSDTQKPVEETPAAAPATEAPAAAEAPAAEAPKETPAAAESTEAAPAAEEPKEEQPKETKEEPKKEVTPASEGVLGYKAPGLVKGLRFSKRFFYFSDEAVEAKQLATYQQNEKPAVAHPTVAWATQTGKGLLFIVKRAEDKATPAGILNLADITDVTKESTTEFLFKINGHKHTFQAANVAERDSWIAAIESKSAAAKAEKETITSSEGYKAELEKLTKPAVPEPKKEAPKETPAAESAEAAPAAEEPKKEEQPKETKEEAKEDAKEKAKSRSRSRKRASIFGIPLGRSEKEAEAPAEKEEKKDEKAEEAKPAEASTEAPAESSTAAEGAETPAAPESAEKKADEGEAKKEEEKKDDKKEEKKDDKKSKRTSIFGNLFQKVGSPTQEKSEKEATASTETPAVSSTAPQLDNPVEGEADKPKEEKADAGDNEPKEGTSAQSPSTETPAANKEKRRTSFFGNFGKKKGDSDNEGTDGESKPKGNKLGGLFRKPSKAVKSEAKETETEAKADKAEAAPKEAPVEESPAEESAKPAEESAKPAEATTNGEESKPANVATTSTPVQAAA